MAFVPLLFAAIFLCLYGVHRYLNRKKLPEGSKRLPGPRGLPFIGRVHDVPPDMTWLKFFEWSKVYGPIYQMEIFGDVHIWISSEQIAHDLLSRRSLINSDRPVIPNLSDNRTSGDYLALLGRTDTWKRQRKLCHHLMASSAAKSLHTYPTRERNRFLYLMWHRPDQYIEWIEQFTSRTVSRLSWGTAHPANTLRVTTFGLLQTISPSGALPNVVNWLAHLPLTLSPWKKKENARKREEERLFKGNVSYVKRMMQHASASPSFIKTFLEDKKREQQTAAEKAQWGEEGEATYVVGLMAIAGALTIGSPIQSFVLAMCHYPEWQARLQEEIDSALGGRCPQWEDREKLPMLRAVVKEVMRWRPPVPTGIPHASEKDDVYNGYFIPAGATIHALEWGITRDESVYPDPETFNPQRWLSPEYPTYREPLTVYPNLNGYSQFGFGRRTCQGVPIVDQDLFLTMGGLAWAFNIRKKRGPDGKEIPVHWNDYTSLLIAKPVKFQFDAVPRSEAVKQEMERMWLSAKEDGDEFELWHRESDRPSVFQEKAKEAESESDHDVLINVRDSSSESSDSDSEGNKDQGKGPEMRTSTPVPGAWV